MTNPPQEQPALTDVERCVRAFCSLDGVECTFPDCVCSPPRKAKYRKAAISAMSAQAEPTDVGSLDNPAFAHYGTEPAQAGRDGVLEEAAKVCSQRATQHTTHASTLEPGAASWMRWIDRTNEAIDCASAIRALKGQSPTRAQERTPGRDPSGTNLPRIAFDEEGVWSLHWRERGVLVTLQSDGSAQIALPPYAVNHEPWDYSNGWPDPVTTLWKTT